MFQSVLKVFRRTSRRIQSEQEKGTGIETFISERIVPQVTDLVPKEITDVHYRDISVNLGNIISPSQVREAPSVSFNAISDSHYTLLMIDPDAPSRYLPLLRNIAHWIVVNIPGNNIADGETLVGYRGAGAPRFSGLHRYVFLVYEQPTRIQFEEQVISAEDRAIRARCRFSVNAFSAKYSFGQPVAGNYFLARWDGM